jgi:hypothetical protein
MDASHYPLTAKELFGKASDLLAKFNSNFVEISGSQQRSLNLKTWLQQRDYGAYVCVAWFVRDGEFCTCTEEDCKERAHHSYAVKDSTFRVKSDFTLEALEIGLRKELQYIRHFIRGVELDSD